MVPFGGEMTTLLSRVLGYTTDLTTPEVVTMPELARWSWSIMPDLGWLWFLPPRLCDRQWEEGLTKVTGAMARVLADDSEETESCS